MDENEYRRHRDKSRGQLIDSKQANCVKSKEFPHAGVAKLADAQDLKSWDSKESCGFDSRPRHQFVKKFGKKPQDRRGC
jgi:hypothetical protein